jgi:SOS-response transcriptional repressor LexA
MRLTESQARVFEALLTFMMVHGKPPTVRELGEKTGITSSNGVCEQLAKLRVRGLITQDPRRSRNTEVAPKGWEQWASMLSERAGVEISASEARLITRAWRELAAIEDAGAVLSSLSKHLGVLQLSAIATP